jgi:hypothetical protein
VKLTTHLQLGFHGVVLNYLITGTTLLTYVEGRKEVSSERKETEMKWRDNGRKQKGKK